MRCEEEAEHWTNGNRQNFVSAADELIAALQRHKTLLPQMGEADCSQIEGFNKQLGPWLPGSATRSLT